MAATISAVVSMIAGIYALFDLIQEVSDIEQQVASPTVVSINVNDICNLGFITTTLSGSIAIFCPVFILLMSLARRPRRVKPSLFISRVPFLVLGGYALWLFIAQAGFTHIFRTRSALVHAYADGVELPDSVVQTIVEPLGVDNEYRHIGYLLPAAILPWFTVLFTVIAAIVAFLASGQVPPTVESPAAMSQREELKETENVQVEYREDKTEV